VFLLTYSIYFSYAIFSTDYKEILKIAGGVKQLTVPLLPEHSIIIIIIIEVTISIV
jgi:hypothetical protein